MYWSARFVLEGIDGGCRVDPKLLEIFLASLFLRSFKLSIAYTGMPVGLLIYFFENRVPNLRVLGHQFFLELRVWCAVSLVSSLGPFHLSL